MVFSARLSEVTEPAAKAEMEHALGEIRAVATALITCDYVMLPAATPQENVRMTVKALEHYASTARSLDTDALREIARCVGHLFEGLRGQR